VIFVANDKDEKLRVFISYSRRDSRWLERLRTHLTPLWQDHEVDVWDDSKIRPGSKWREEIRAAVESASVAVLILSADFLASDFVRTNELPPLLKAAEEEGALILPIVASPSLFLRNSSLAQFQAVNSPSTPLISASEGDQENTFLKVAEAILARAGTFRDPSSRFLEASQKIANEDFLRQEDWTRLIKIGDWIFDRDSRKVIGAGRQAYLLSRSEYGEKPFCIDARLAFSDINSPTEGTFGMNAGIVFGWHEEKQIHRYYHILLTGEAILVERIGFNGGNEHSDFEHITSETPFPIEPRRPVTVNLNVNREQISVSSSGKVLITLPRPTGVTGRVGLRPWRSKMDCLKFSVSE
jgi:hypothetical protein